MGFDRNGGTVNKVTLVTEPHIILLAEMQLDKAGLEGLVEWLSDYAPQCLDPEEEKESAFSRAFPHNGARSAEENAGLLSDNELLVELSGRKCYNSFGKKAGRGTNAKYVANLLGSPGKIPHASVLYHAKMSFFFAGIGRRVSHEIIRHYVGADRTEEGSPSQESTRYTHHPGHFTVHPRIADNPVAVEFFREAMQQAYDHYLAYIASEVALYKVEHGEQPKGTDRKRIYEAAAQLLPGAACTSFVWTTNPMALQKMFTERCDVAADLEIQRFALKLRDICYTRWPNLFRESNPECRLAEVAARVG